MSDQSRNREGRAFDLLRAGVEVVTGEAPDNEIPEEGLPAISAMRLIDQELVLDGIPERNLATFVTTWMEPEAQRIIAENSHRNFIDHAGYPQTAEIEQRCIRMLADLFNTPGETTGARTQGSSEAAELLPDDVHVAAEDQVRLVGSASWPPPGAGATSTSARGRRA